MQCKSRLLKGVDHLRIFVIRYFSFRFVKRARDSLYDPFSKLKINSNMRREGNSQRHKDTKMFTGEDDLNARSRTRLILGNRKSNQN